MEYITANGIEYRCKTVTTGINSISFTMEGQAIEAVYSTFKDVTGLTVSGEDKITYGIYENLSFTSVTGYADDIVCVTMSTKSALEVAVEELKVSQEIQDEAIVELAKIITGGE